MRRGLAWIAVGIWCLHGFAASVASGHPDMRGQTPAHAGEAISSVLSYNEYMADFEDADTPNTDIVISPDQADGGERVSVEGLGGENNYPALIAGDRGEVNYTFSAERDGWYQLYISYCTVKGKDQPIERRLLLDGKAPFREAESVSLNRVWSNGMEISGGKRRFETDSMGNERLPEKREILEWTSCWVRDTGGYQEQPLYFKLSKGMHTLTLTAVREAVILGELRFAQAPKLPSYAEYASLHADKPAIKEYSFSVQGEDFIRTSHAQTNPTTDRTSCATWPSDPENTLLNTVGGSNWSTIGQWIEWTVTVPKDGLYNLSVKYRQNFLSGMVANRILTVDGVQPFIEAGEWVFPYSSGWKTSTLGNRDGPYQIFLSEGPHTLRLTCSLGQSAKLLQKAEQIVSSLGTSYSRLVMYMGASPDIDRDYQVDKRLPDVMAAFRDQLTALTELSDELVTFSGARGNANVALDNLADVLARMVRDARTVGEQLSTLRDYTASLSAWIQEQSRQSLQLDTVSVLGTQTPPAKAAASFWQEMLYQFRLFFASFSKDYTQFYDTADGEPVEVWVNTGRDQAQVIKNLITNTFTPQTGVGVKLNLVGGQLLLATVSGTGPDVSLMNGSADIMNFAFRSALEPLNGYEGFPGVIEPYEDSALVPMQWDGKTYGLPETQSFPVLFYRKDILEKLSLTVPQTWTQLIPVMGELQKNNLQFGYMTGLAGYGMMLVQRGEALYTADGSSCRFSSEVGTDVFKVWTRLFTNYGLPLEYNAVTRFRAGEMPLLVADYTLYNTLSVSAPEIKGLWDFSPVFGTEQEDGSVNRSVLSGVSGCVMMSGSKHKNSAWKFMKWWSGTDTQTRYGKEIESILGPSARYAAANTMTLESLPWSAAEYRMIRDGLRTTVGVPEVPGSYYTSRHLENAFRRVVNYGEDERETIETYTRAINEEILYKRRELRLDS